jgi:hypothetical protein
MILITPLLGWTLAGFLGGMHCMGMCGGLAAALGIQSAKQGRFRLLLAANLGRLASYAMIGALLGGLGQAASWLPMAIPVQQGLYFLSLVLIMLLGLYLAGASFWLTRIERIGIPLWRIVQPRFQRLLPLQTIKAAFLAGAMWGWLPCGMVYTAGMAALASGSPSAGFLTLLAFGLGTLPNLLAMGMAAKYLDPVRRHAGVRLLAGGLLFLYGAAKMLQWFTAAM